MTVDLTKLSKGSNIYTLLVLSVKAVKPDLDKKLEDMGYPDTNILRADISKHDKNIIKVLFSTKSSALCDELDTGPLELGITFCPRNPFSKLFIDLVKNPDDFVMPQGKAKIVRRIDGKEVSIHFKF